MTLHHFDTAALTHRGEGPYRRDLRSDDLYRRDLFVLDETHETRSCACYPHVTSVSTHAHLPGCEYYDCAYDPFVRPRWYIHKLDRLWTVCQVRTLTGYHDPRYRGKTWDDAKVWLAVEYGRRRSERRALENANPQAKRYKT